VNADVLPPIGGYLPVCIYENGYIKVVCTDYIVHRETRGLDRHDECQPSLRKAKERLHYLCWPDDLAVLELTPGGGGAALWMREEQVEELSARRDRFRSCYGSWPIKVLTA
jgi:hypothetical protein